MCDAQVDRFEPFRPFSENLILVPVCLVHRVEQTPDVVERDVVVPWCDRIK
jgi:hypothetical protein